MSIEIQFQKHLNINCCFMCKGS